MAKRKRNIQNLFCVSPEEKELIRRKMIESKTKNMGAYLRKMAIDGYIVHTDTTPLKKQYEEMHKIGVNINKIALATHSFSSKSSHGFKPISSQVMPYGAPPEVFVFGLCQLYNETKRPGFPDLLILFMDFSFTNTKYD